MTTLEGRDNAVVPFAVDALPVNLAVLDDEGTILWSNRAWREFGEANDIALRPETIGVNYLDVTAAADDEYAQQAESGLREVLAGDRTDFDLEYPCHSPDEKRWFLMRAAPFTHRHRRGAIVAHVDITARVESEYETERFKRACEAASHVVFITDTTGEITYVNPAFEAVTGYTAHEALERTPRILKSGEHDPAIYTELWETILSGESWEGTLINRRKSGGLFYVYAVIEPILDETGDVTEFVAVQTEITDIEEMRQQLQAQDDLLRHELRTHLNLIQLYAEELEYETQTDFPQVEKILGVTDDLLEIAEKTRDLRRFLTRTTEPEPVDVTAIARTVAEEQRARYPDATIELDAPETAVALSVPDLKRALTELLENSVEHSDIDSPTVTVTVSTTTTDDAVRLTVADDGPGIPPLEYETFEGKQPTPLTHGTGLGLNIAYWIARRSGGQFHVESNDSRGATVTIQLPKTREKGATY